ncbi:MAG: ribonuclease R [Wenzhouxiangellaceae bacterium]
MTTSIDADRLLAVLEKADRPLGLDELADALALAPDQAASLEAQLATLLRSGRVVRNRRGAYGLPERMDLVPGRVSAHPDGFGFLVPDTGGDDLYLSRREMRQVFDGDRVLARVVNVDRRGRKEGQIVEVLERAREVIVGRFVAENGVAFVVPDDPKLTHDVLLPKVTHPDARPGKIVAARIISPPTLDRQPLGEIVAVLGHADEPGIATEIAIFNHGLPDAFPKAVLAEAESYGDEVDPNIAADRVDMRPLPLVTIDGPDARDFDDAVYAEKHDRGYRLIVAIADVAEYVQPGSALDTEAMKRGTSTYFPDRVVPMLPELLSNGLCSLNPGVDRLALACDMQLDERGKVVKSRFIEAVIRSAARLTYDQALALFKDPDAESKDRHRKVLPSLQTLFEIYRLLARRRERRGALDFDSSEVQFVFAPDGRVEKLLRRQRHDAHRLIEECMITANVEAARQALKIGLPTLFRVHEPPPPDKLSELESFLRLHGLKITWKDSPKPADLARIQRQVQGRPIQPVVEAVLLRSLALAVYQPENRGHFGLALDSYAHFTSPIRRYPDLLLHRALKHHLRRAPRRQYPYSAKAMEALGRECSWLERRAEEASRDVDERLKCQYMQRHIGEEFDGVISGVTGFGLFVELLELGVSGLVHVTSLPNDYYHFDPTARTLTGERRGLRYRLADLVRVQVVGVNADERKIDFRIAGEGGDGGRKPRRKTSRKKRRNRKSSR